MNRMEDFLALIVKLGKENPGVEINKKIIYSQLIRYDLNGFNYSNEDNLDDKALNITSNVESYLEPIGTKMTNNNAFLWFMNGELSGNEIKLYIPLPLETFEQGSKDLFEFITKENIVHQSKIAKIYRNDNVVVRVTNMEDANKIMEFVKNTPSLNRYQQPNPFVPNINGVGITMDNIYSYNSEVSELIEQAYRLYGESLNLQSFNSFINRLLSAGIGNLDIKDIYTILELQTNKDKNVNDIINFLNYKLIDKYDLTPGDNFRVRITDPKFYLEQAIKETYNKTGNISSLKVFLKSPDKINGITRNNKAREGVIKYVKNEDVMSIIKDTLIKNKIDITNMDEDIIIDNYLNMILKIKSIKSNLDKTQELPEVTCYNVLENAIKDTQLVHPNNNNCLSFLKQILLNEDINVNSITRNNGARDSVEKMFEKYPNIDYVAIAVNLLSEIYGIESQTKTM